MTNILMFEDLFASELNRINFIQQCVITNYAYDETAKIGTCSVILHNIEGETENLQFDNIPCYVVGKKLTWDVYTSGLLIKVRVGNTNFEAIQQQAEVHQHQYDNTLLSCYIAIVLPVEELLGNTLTQEIIAQNQISLKTTGDIDANAEAKSGLEIACVEDKASATLTAGENSIKLDGDANLVSVESKGDMTIKSESAIELGTSGGQLAKVLEDILDTMQDIATSQTQPCVQGAPTTLLAATTAPAKISTIKQTLGQILK